jgi:hypothetical protein
LPQINLKTSYQNVDKTKIKKKAHIKCFECSTLEHFSSECPNRKSNQVKPSRRQRSLSKRRCFDYKKKYHNIVDCPKEASKQVCQNRTVRFVKPEYPVSAENSKTSGQCNKGFKVTLDKHMSKNKSIKRQSKDKASRIKHQTCYTYHDKGHLSKYYPKTQNFIHKVANDHIPHVGPKNDTSSPYDGPHVIWVPKHLLTNSE